MSLKDFTIRFKPFIEQVKYYLQQNAPDILESYDIGTELSWDFDNTYLVFKSNRLRTNSGSKIRLNDVGGSIIITLDDANFSLYNYAADVRFNDKDKDWKTLLDDKIVHLRKLDRDLNNAFEEAIAYYKILNKDSDDYYFAFNFYQGKIHYVQLVPGLLQEFLAYEKLVNNIDDETYKKYEEDCLNNFKKETKEYNTKADAFSPVATIPTYKTWVEDKKAEEPIEDTALNIANEQCKEILDKINQ